MNTIISKFLDIYKRDFKYYSIKYNENSRELLLVPNKDISAELIDILIERFVATIYTKLRKNDIIHVIINYESSKRLLIFQEGSLYLDSHSKIIGPSLLQTIHETDLNDIPY